MQANACIETPVKPIARLPKRLTSRSACRTCRRSNLRKASSWSGSSRRWTYGETTSCIPKSGYPTDDTEQPGASQTLFEESRLDHTPTKQEPQEVKSNGEGACETKNLEPAIEYERCERSHRPTGHNHPSETTINSTPIYSISSGRLLFYPGNRFPYRRCLLRFDLGSDPSRTELREPPEAFSIRSGCCRRSTERGHLDPTTRTVDIVCRAPSRFVTILIVGIGKVYYRWIEAVVSERYLWAELLELFRVVLVIHPGL